MKHPDGSTISQYFQTTEQPTSGDDIYNQGLRLMIGQVEKIHYVDDQSNVSKSFVEYDVSVRNAKGGQSTLRNVRQVNLLGGTNDYEETVLESNDYAFKGKLEKSNFFVNKNGTTVLVAFIDGSSDKPLILAAIPHPKRIGSKRSQGINKNGEYRGIKWEINKDGEMIITHQGPRSPDGKLKTAETVLTIVKFDKQGNFTITDHSSNQIFMDNVNVKVTIAAGAAGTKIEQDGKNDKTTIALAGGLNMVFDGKSDIATLTTSGGTKVEIDGAGNIKMTAGSTVINIDGNSGKISLLGDFIDLGASVSDFVTKFQALAAAFNSHTHIKPAGTSAAPTSPPTGPLLVTVGSQTVKVQS